MGSNLEKNEGGKSHDTLPYISMVELFCVHPSVTDVVLFFYPCQHCILSLFSMSSSQHCSFFNCIIIKMIFFIILAESAPWFEQKN